jgi:hypothetical protein
MNRVFSSVPAELSTRGVPSDEQHLYKGNCSPTIEITEHQEQQAFLNPVFNNANHNQMMTPESRSSILARLTIWWFEVVSLLIGVGALGAIIIMLLKFDGKEQPAWKYSVNLNTLVSILSTLLRVCMLYGVEEGNTSLYSTCKKADFSESPGPNEMAMVPSPTFAPAP